MKTWVFAFIAVRGFQDGAEEYFVTPTAWYYIKSLGQTQTFLGLVLSAYCVSAILAGPSFGRLADKCGGHKRIIVFCYFLKVAGNLIYSIPVSAYFPLLGRFISGISTASNGLLFVEVALHTKKKHLARVFILLDGMFCMGAAFGPALGSFVTFNANILGWKIDAGNSPGVILATMWLCSTIVALFLPNDLGYDKTAMDKKMLVLQSDGERDFLPTEQDPINQPKLRFNAEISCLLYLTFWSMFFMTTTTYYVPVLALEHYHLLFIHVKLLFVASSMFGFVLFFSLYIATEYFDERKLLAFLMLMQIAAIALLTYIACSWDNVSWNESYILIPYVCLGMPMVSFNLISALLSKIIDPKDAGFYQGICYAMFHLGFILGRTISSFIFAKTSLILYCLGLTFLWLVGALWFSFEYPKLVEN